MSADLPTPAAAGPSPAVRVAWEGCERPPAASGAAGRPTAATGQPPVGVQEAPPGLWRARFKVSNDGAAPVRVESAWLPHGRFRGPGGPVSHASASAAAGPAAAPGPEAAPLLIPPGGQAPLALDVAFHEPPGTAVENAFLILVVRVGDAPTAAGPGEAPGAAGRRQRIFARYTVEAAPDGSPRPRLEALTAQAVGFAAGGAPGTPNPPACPGSERG